MSYKTILTYLPSPDRAQALLDVAIPIARDNDAHLVGLHVVPRVLTLYAADVQIPQDVIARQHETLRKEAAKVRDVFEETAGRAGVKSEWRCNDARYSDVVEDVAEQALCADLVVVGQAVNGATGASADDPANIVMQTGRPVLVVPDAGRFEGVGKRVLVAWNGSREAARAAFDAMPLMTGAKSVRVLAIDPKERGGHDNISLGDELALCLARHGVAAEATVSHGSEISVGDQILNRLADESCDLLVMGCYGHSRIRETIFGGATHELLRHMTVPVLMSH